MICHFILQALGEKTLKCDCPSDKCRSRDGENEFKEEVSLHKMAKCSFKLLQFTIRKGDCKTDFSQYYIINSNYIFV